MGPDGGKERNVTSHFATEKKNFDCKNKKFQHNKISAKTDFNIDFIKKLDIFVSMEAFCK